MTADMELIAAFYQALPHKIERIKAQLNHRPLTLTEKILYAHLAEQETSFSLVRGVDYVNFMPDRVAMQDATAQMALLQLMNSGRDRVAVPTTVHCDHLIQAYIAAKEDLITSSITNKEVFDFLRTVSTNFGIGFWKPGAGIIHQVLLENYAFPGGMMIGTDSHTPNAGGLGMIAIGVGGADAVDVMAGRAWELKMPQLIGVKLTGKLSGWSSPKDVILKLAGILTVKGGTNAIIEYFGAGTHTISATGKASICNMGAEVGATTSIFPYDQLTAAYLQATDREEIAKLATQVQACLQADPAVEESPESYYDRVIEIDLSTLTPYINGPFTPDAACSLNDFAKQVVTKGYPQQLEVGLIGSCTNSSYEDLARAASVIQDALSKQVEIKGKLIINPGSEQVRATAERDGLLAIFKVAGAVIMANACGPCIGQWKRSDGDNQRPNSILTSFNRNFSKRNDGNPNTHAFVSSPEVVAALTIAGTLTFNPLTDPLINKNGESVTLNEPIGDQLPQKGFDQMGWGYEAPATGGAMPEIGIDPQSERLQRLVPFAPWNGQELENLSLLIKAKGKCTTDHISMAGVWLTYRGHLDRISDNLLMGAENAFNGLTNSVRNPLTGSYEPVSVVARALKAKQLESIIVAEENYGEGSSREHAAMEPRFLGVRVVLTKSFARIHETNLKKQGMLALTFVNEQDYDKIKETDTLSIHGLQTFQPNTPLEVIITHADGSNESIVVAHTYNELQIGWFKAGSAR